MADSRKETPSGSSRDRALPPRRSWRKKLFTGLVLGALLLLALPFLLVLLLKLPAVREGVLERVAAEVEQSTGLPFAAEDFSLAASLGTVELRGVRLGPEARPLLTLPRATAELALRPSMLGRLTLRRLILESPQIDLGAPMPRVEADGAAAGEPMNLELIELHVNDGRILGPPPTDPESWLHAWRLEGLEIEGSFRESQLDARLTDAELHAEAREVEPITARLTGALSGPVEGPFALDNLQLDGRELHLQLSGLLGMREDQPLVARFSLDTDPGALLPNLAEGSRLRAEGDLDLRTWAGEASLQARELPAELVEPWVGRDTLRNLNAAESLLDVDAKLLATARAPLTAHAQIEWRRRAKKLLQVNGRASVPRQAGGQQPDLESLEGTLQLDGQKLPAALLAPWLGEHAETLALAGTEVDLKGDLEVRGRTAGQGEIVARWRRGTETLLAATARLPAVPPSGPARLSFEAELLPGEAGRRHLAGQLHAPDWQQLVEGSLRQTHLDLDLPAVQGALDNMTQRWPALVPAALRDLPLAGALTLDIGLGGRLLDPETQAKGLWRLDDGSQVVLQASGLPARRSGEAQIDITRFELGQLEAGVRGPLSGSLTFAGSAEAFEATLSLDAPELLDDAGQPLVERLALRASSNGRRLEIERLDGVREPLVFQGTGGFEISLEDEKSLGNGALRLVLEAPDKGLLSTEVDLALSDGVLTLDAPRVDTEAGHGELVASVPLASLTALPAFAEIIPTLPMVTADGPVELRFVFPGLDSQRLLPLLGLEERRERVRAHLAGEWRLDPADPVAGQAEIRLADLDAEIEGRRLQTADTLQLTLEERRLRLAPVTLLADGRPLDIEGHLDLSPSWRPGDPLDDLAGELILEAHGAVEARLLNPYLPAGYAEGEVKIDATAKGHLDNLEADLKIAAPEASLTLQSPYLTHLEDLHAELVIRDGRGELKSATGTLNEGTLEVNGHLEPDGSVTLKTTLDGVRYRLDYGLSTELDAALSFVQPAEGRGRLDGTVTVVRGVLRRNIRLEDEVLAFLFAPAELAAAGQDPLDQIDLDLKVKTRDGVRVRNNLADLKVVWRPLTVRGTLTQPLIRGELEVEPDGFVTLPGQVLRLDGGQVIFPGTPGAEPRLEIQSTSSLDDPTVLEQRPRSLFENRQDVDERRTASASEANDLSTSLSAYVGGELAQRAGETALGGLLRASVGATPLFGETDTSARLNLISDLSPYLSLAISNGLREAESRIYILDLHGLRALPSMSLKAFTTDDSTEGLTLEQSLFFGDRSKKNEDTLLLGKLRFEAEGLEIPRKELERAVDLRGGEPVPSGAGFDAEVELIELLRRRGYPRPRVEATLVPTPERERRRDLQIQIEPGPHATYVFEGDKLAAGQRNAITALYRLDFLEETSLEEMRQQTVRGFRALGHLEPEVEVSATPLSPDSSARQVVIRSEAGPNARLAELHLEGLPTEEAEIVGARFESKLRRAELAVGITGSDQLLLAAIRQLGYGKPRIAGRRLSEDGRILTVELEPGLRQKVVDVRTQGLGSQTLAALGPQADDPLAKLPIQKGDPAQGSAIAAAVLQLETELRANGFTDARVQPKLTPVGGSEGDLVLELDVDSGPLYRIDEVSVSGLHRSRPAWVRKVSELEPGQELRDEDLEKARKKLRQAGPFNRVGVVSERGEDGGATVTLDLKEAPRFSIATGLRWENQGQTSGSLEVVNHNLLGRGLVVGLRALYAPDDQSLRILARTPYLGGTLFSFEVFGELREEREEAENLLTETGRISLALSRPFGRRLTGRAYGTFRRTTVSEIEPDPIFPFPPFVVKAPFLGLQLIWDGRDDPLRAQRGLFASADLSGADDFLGSELRFLRFFGQVSHFYPIGQIAGRHLTWAHSYRVGLGEGLGSQDLDRQDRFFAGGEYSVRGYPTESLGPVESSGNVDRPRGGDALLILNQELRFPVWGPLAGLVFVDAGNVWAETSDFASRLRTSTGFGLRASTPGIGLLRLDLAFPLDRRPDDPTYRVYVGFGNTF